MTGARHGARRGVTLIEMLISMIVGLAVLSTVTAYVGTTDRNISGATAREDYTRKARFLGLAFRRDLGEAGVGMTSLQGFGAVAAFTDTVVILKVPYTPNPDPAYNVALNPVTTVNATTNSGSAIGCGSLCLRLRRVASGTALTLAPGMLARIQQGTVRRLIVIGTVANPAAADSVSVTFRSAAAVMHRPSVTSAAPLGLISNTNTTVQRLDMVAYWRDAQNNLWRATMIDPLTGNFSNGEIVAAGCTAFAVRLVFQDGTTGAAGDSTLLNHYNNDINAILLSFTIASDYTDLRINGGQPLKRGFTIRVQPRNLIYERNWNN